MQHGLAGRHSRLLDLVRLAGHGQPIPPDEQPALLFAWRLLGEPLSFWHGAHEILQGITGKIADGE